MELLFYYFLCTTFVGFLLTAYDKFLAKRHQHRISEKMLLFIVFFGGTIGAGFAMFLFRHKTSKSSFLLKYWCIALIQLVIVVYMLYPY